MTTRSRTLALKKPAPKTWSHSGASSRFGGVMLVGNEPENTPPLGNVAVMVIVDVWLYFNFKKVKWL